MIILKIVLIFLFLILLLRLKVPFIISILLTALSLGLTFNLSPRMMIETAWATAVKDTTTLNLMGIVGLILVFSEFLKNSGYLTQLGKAITQLLGTHRLTLATMPALIGLLPMPGGALFSAPLVEMMKTDASTIPPHIKTLFNHWFRHIWEYSWPLYPGIILAAELTELPLSTLCYFQLPLTLLAIGVGIICIFPSINLSPKPTPSSTAAIPSVRPEPPKKLYRLGTCFKILYLLLPIILVIALFLFMKMTLLLALLIGCGWVALTSLISRRLTLPNLLKIAFAKPAVYHMILMVFSVMIFVNIMKQSSLSDNLTGFFYQYQTGSAISLNIIAIIFLPFIVGLLTGLTIAFAGTTIPIIFNVFIPPDPSGGILPYIMLGYASGFIGVLISPTHLCLILTNKYFGSTLGQVYRRLIPIALIFLVIVLGLFFLYTML